MASRLGELVVVPPGEDKYVCEWLTQNIAGNHMPYLLANADTNYKEIAKLYDRFICLHSIPAAWLADKTSTVRVVYVNTEPMTSKTRRNDYERYVAYPGVEDIWDYSEANIAITGRGRLVKCVPSNRELLILKTLLAITPKTHDIAIVNLWYPRRRALADELKRRGWSVLEINTFGQGRDAAIASARVLLNWHTLDDTRVYEELRCERWRLAGMPVITESCVNAVLPNDLLVVPTDDVAGIEREMCALFPKHAKCVA
jgi:hypothetical protein